MVSTSSCGSSGSIRLLSGVAHGRGRHGRTIPEPSARCRLPGGQTVRSTRRYRSAPIVVPVAGIPSSTPTSTWREPAAACRSVYWPASTAPARTRACPSESMPMNWMDRLRSRAAAGHVRGRAVDRPLRPDRADLGRADAAVLAARAHLRRPHSRVDLALAAVPVARGQPAQQMASRAGGEQGIREQVARHTERRSGWRRSTVAPRRRGRSRGRRGTAEVVRRDRDLDPVGADRVQWTVRVGSALGAPAVRPVASIRRRSRAHARRGEAGIEPTRAGR